MSEVYDIGFISVLAAAQAAILAECEFRTAESIFVKLKSPGVSLLARIQRVRGVIQFRDRSVAMGLDGGCVVPISWRQLAVEAGAEAGGDRLLLLSLNIPSVRPGWCALDYLHYGLHRSFGQRLWWSGLSASSPSSTDRLRQALERLGFDPSIADRIASGKKVHALSRLCFGIMIRERNPTALIFFTKRWHSSVIHITCALYPIIHHRWPNDARLGCVDQLSPPFAWPRVSSLKQWENFCPNANGEPLDAATLQKLEGDLKVLGFGGVPANIFTTNLIGPTMTV